MKAKKKFTSPFIGTSLEQGFTLLYSCNGNYSIILKIENLALQYCADETVYDNYHNVLGHIIKILGANYILQKTDIIGRKAFVPPVKQSDDYLDKKYFEYFEGRSFNEVTTYLTITHQNTKGRFFAYNAGEIKDFINKIRKVVDTLNSSKIPVEPLNEEAIKALQNRYMAFNFTDDQYSFSNIGADRHKLQFGENKELKIISLIDIDELNIPNTITSHANKPELGKNFPTDNLSFLLSVPESDTIIYSQSVFIPEQIKVKSDLESKKKRHTSMPDAANEISAIDIDQMFLEIASNNEMLVYCNYSVLILADKDVINKCINYIDTNLFAMGIIPGRNTYNQMELFRSAIPGNADELKTYDKFLTSRPGAVCFFFKEKLPETEKSDYLLYFTDRQGVPVGIDTSELPMQTNRISNRNKFILGPSGSGKSFTNNRYIKQCHVLGADVVLVDTGHSYFGSNRYFDGKYITYSEEKPITMNPFRIEQVENNEEKRQILKSLVGLIWKGVDGTLSQVEDTVLSKCISDYYTDFFGSKLKVKNLSFNTFYEFSCSAVEQLLKEESITFDLPEFRFVLKKFYKGGEYEKILNDDFDKTLFSESFIVFEIDSIKEHKLLFPITTLIIMDVFIQKMRYKKNKKILVIEEAWKAIASPMMAGYILYLYKTVRKFAGEAIIVTQELGDILGNAIVKESIIANSDTIMLLDQSKFRDNFDEVAKLLSINEVEKNKIFTINRLDNKENRGRFKEVYIKRGSTGEVYGVELPIEEYLTYTTERPEREALEYYLDQYDTYENAINAMVADFNKSGLSLPAFIKQVNTSIRKFSLQEMI
jgi:conjugation system TraG family ATPase